MFLTNSALILLSGTFGSVLGYYIKKKYEIYADKYIEKVHISIANLSEDDFINMMIENRELIKTITSYFYEVNQSWKEEKHKIKTMFDELYRKGLIPKKKIPLLLLDKGIVIDTFFTILIDKSNVVTDEYYRGLSWL